MWHRRQREGGRGRSLSKDHYSPHRMPSADLAASQLSTLFLPFNPLPWQVRESHAVGPTRRHSIWSVTPIKQCRTVAFQELLKQPMATLMMETLFGLIHAPFEPHREDLTSLRLNNGPSIDGLVGGQGGDKCTVTFSSLQRPLMCDLRSVY